MLCYGMMYTDMGGVLSAAMLCAAMLCAAMVCYAMMNMNKNMDMGDVLSAIIFVLVWYGTVWYGML
jgi:hypothetical protein